MDALQLIDLRERAFLVTGASSGIGRSTALLLSRVGARIVLVGRNESRLQETLHSCQGTDHVALPWDVANYDSLEELVDRSVASVGKLHGVVHCAGLQISRPVQMLTSEHLRMMSQVNVDAAIGMAAAFARRSESAGGSIVLMASVMGLVGQAAQSGYCATKGALIAAARSLALELAKSRIRVNCVAASLVETEMCERLRKTMPPTQFERVVAMHPLGLGSPSDVASTIAFLLSDAARWMTGTTVVVDGGYSAH